MGECLCEFESRSGHHRCETGRLAAAAEREYVLPQLVCVAAQIVPAGALRLVRDAEDPGMTEIGARLLWAYESLLSEFGSQGWWPGRDPFEIMVGAVLTQNAAWRNAERAIERLREAGALTPAAVTTLPLDRLEQLVRSAGAWRRKARTLAALAETIEGEKGGLQGLLSSDPVLLRETLLAIRGIGPETADAMLLYAAGYPVFVVDAYTRRFVERHGIADARAPYDAVQRLFTDALGHDADAFAECHALFVELGKRFCHPEPICCECPLRKDLPQT